MNFYPRSPCGERQRTKPAEQAKALISIHALLAESDYTHPVAVFICIIFLSTLSLRRATHPLLYDIVRHIYFYPRSPCGERPQGADFGHKMISISIHALLAESDLTTLPVFYAFSNFYPRSPCGERPPPYILMIHHAKNFYPRSPCGERPLYGCYSLRHSAHFYPRSPCGERRRL